MRDIDRETSVKMLAFNLKMLAKRSEKNFLISAGSLENKQRLLPHIRDLGTLNVNIFATEGTSRFLHEEGVDNNRIYKIAERNEPNIKSFLTADRFDLVVNLLVGDNDYDETSDSNLIRTLSIENEIPLITDTDVAIATFERLQISQEEAPQTYSSDSWDLKAKFLSRVRELGGFANHHAHFDKAYLISLENLKLGQVDMQKKWKLYRFLKENYTFDDLVERISRGVEMMIAQGAVYCRTLVDADSRTKLLPIEAALEVKKRYRDKITFEIGTQPLEGVLDPESFKYFVKACELADYVGGLPSRDRPTPEKHIDIILDIARDLGKMVDVHVDQENNPEENETEMLARKCIDHGMQGQVNAVHAISLAAKPNREQDEIVSIVKDAGIGVIVCPSAALSMKALDKTAPIHNSIAPIPKLLNAGVPIYMGIDNVYDLFMPFCDGDIWTECRLLMEATRFYEIEKLAQIACRVPIVNVASVPQKRPQAQSA